MKKIKLLFAALLSMMAWTGVMAQDPDKSEYEAALAAITDGAAYIIKTNVNGTYYYLKNDGYLTATKDDGSVFSFKQVQAAGTLYENGWNLGCKFTNPSLSGGSSGDIVNDGHIHVGSNDRNDWERQVFFKKDNTYAIRSTNANSANWGANTYWCVTAPEGELPKAEYSLGASYDWEFEFLYDEEGAEKRQAAYATTQTWITAIQAAKGLVKDVSQFSSNAKESTEGSYEALLDDTYTTFFHSQWSGTGPDADHYLQIELSEATETFHFYYKKRSQNNNNRPTAIVISASNDGENFTDVTTIDEGLPTAASVIDYLSDVIDLGGAYKYVRFTIPTTNNGQTNNNHVFFTFSEFYMLPDIPEAAAAFAIIKKGTPALKMTDAELAEIEFVDASLKASLNAVTVTYELYEADGTTLISKKEVVQEGGSEVNVPAELITNTKFYDYPTTGTIGNEDCTIKVVRTLKAGVVGALADLSNEKAYTITCDRGALLTKDGYVASTAHSSLSNANPGQFAIISYEDNYYLYSVADSKFMTFDPSVSNEGSRGPLADMPTHGIQDAIKLDAKTTPYFLAYFTAGGTNYGFNTNGNDPYGYVINSWMSADAGNQYYMVEAAEFDPTDAIAALDAYFHPAYTVTYVVKDTKGNVIFTSEPQGTTLGAQITALPDDFKRAFYTYNNVNVTVSGLETTAEFTATWDGPFEISADFESAHWYDMSMRSTWYVTSAEKDGDGAYKTQNANTFGLVEDSYHWAFIGNGYEGFKIINKAEGDGMSFGWTDDNQKNQGIPTIMSDSEGHHAWKIVPSTNTTVPAGSFCLNVPGTNLYINQYGGAGGSVKFWESANNIGDAGSAFTVFDIPDDFSSYVASEIAPALEATGYFTFTDEVKDAIGYDESMKTYCSFDDYKAMKEALAEAMEDISNFILPEAGYYILKNKNYGTYLGMDPSDCTLWGNYQAANAVKNVVFLNKVGDNTFEISLEGVYAPATVEQSQPVLAAEEAGTYTLVIPAVGYAAFQADPAAQFSALHCRAEGDIVGWEAGAAASQWTLEDATSIDLAIGEAGLATTCLPFAVVVPEGVTAYTGTLNGNGDHLVLNKVESNIPAETPVVLEAAAGTYSFEIADDLEAIENNDLKGTLLATPVANALTLQTIDDALGFYTFNGNAVPANKAYLEGTSNVKISFGDVATGIKNVQLAGENTIYNLAGQRVNNAQKGIYIVNGQKLVK